MLLAEIVSTSRVVAATRSRKAKVTALAAALEQAGAEEVETAVAYLAGTLRQRRTGLGWRGLVDLPAPAHESTLTVSEVHGAFETISAISGAGSQASRKAAVIDLFGRASADEQAWLRTLVTGEVRQGALDAVVQEAVAVVVGVPVASVRRGAMLSGSTLTASLAAFEGGEAALAALRLEVGRPVLPMLASSAPDVTAAMTKAVTVGPVAIDAKLDGIRIQAHRRGDEVLLVTRSLDDITSRLPEVVEVVRALPGGDLVLDGEALLIGPEGRPRPFQETSSRTARSSGEAVLPYFFDLLHLDGNDLLDAPAHERLAALDTLVPEQHRVARLVTDDPDMASGFVEATLANGHEGVIVKDPEARYDAGRRGSAWVKVKPVHTLDLVVLAVEWGSGRRQGLLSNIHLGALDPATDGFTMLGKTFKGMTDEMLTWQTERFLSLQTHREGHVVHVRPEQVVEIAIDGVQRSTRYPGGVALRFARVIRYRDDKRPEDVDTLDAVRALL